MSGQSLHILRDKLLAGSHTQTIDNDRRSDTLYVNEGACYRMITHHIIDTKQYAYIEIMGSPKVDEYIKAATIFAQDPNYTAELDRICDFSQANLSTITLHDINEFANFVIENIPLGQHTKVALVAPDDESRRGIFESFMTRMGTGRFKLFTDPDDAATWVHDH